MKEGLLLSPDHFKTTSPQGDGNYMWLKTGKQQLHYFKTTSPQGDGNHFAFSFRKTN